MRDLTQGPIPGQLVAIVAPIAAGMPAQTLNFLIDLAMFVVMLPAFWLSTVPGHKIDHVWMLSVASVWLQACLSVVLLQRTMRARLA